jgi:hypothetical protein
MAREGSHQTDRSIAAKIVSYQPYQEPRPLMWLPIEVN